MMQIRKSDPRTLFRERQEKAKRIRELKLRVIKKVISKIDIKLLNSEKEKSAVFKRSHEKLEQAISGVVSNLGMPEEAGKRLIREILEHCRTFSILSDYILDTSISRILVNQKDSIFVEENETMSMVNREFASNAHLARTIQHIVKLGGTRIGPDQPVADVSLEEGIWITAVLPPVAAPGPVLTIHKPAGIDFSLEDLVDKETMSRSIAQFLEACVQGKRNIIVSGLSGSGRTTLLNTLLNVVSLEERILAIEDRGEIKLSHPNSSMLRPQYNVQGAANSLSSEIMLQTALRMRPDRLVLGDCRGAETLEFLQALSSGLKGGLTTCHASSPTDLIARLETLILLSRETLSPKAVKNIILTGIDLIVHVERLSDRSHRITHITELTGMEGDILTRSDLFRFRNLGTDAHGTIDGIFEPTGIIPGFMQELEQMGITIPRELF